MLPPGAPLPRSGRMWRAQDPSGRSGDLLGNRNQVRGGRSPMRWMPAGEWSPSWRTGAGDEAAPWNGRSMIAYTQQEWNHLIRQGDPEAGHALGGDLASWRPKVERIGARHGLSPDGEM